MESIKHIYDGLKTTVTTQCDTKDNRFTEQADREQATGWMDVETTATLNNSALIVTNVTKVVSC